jgi:hypothetical protein
LREIILFVCGNIAQIKFSDFISSECKLNSGIKSALIADINDNLNIEYIQNIDYFLKDINLLPGFLKKVRLVVFFNYQSVFANRKFLHIGILLKKTNTPFISLQHGLIEPGLNFHSDGKIIDTVSTSSHTSIGIFHFNKFPISWDGPSGIGYPWKQVKSSNLDLLTMKIKINILVCTNFNWGVYNNEEIYSFIRMINILKINYPHFDIRIKPHGSENLINMDLFNYRLKFSDFNFKIFDDKCISESIDWSDIVITTPSSTIIDSLSAAKPTFIFSTKIFLNNLIKFKKILFNNSDDLNTLIISLLRDKKYEWPKLKEFDTKKFLELIDSNSNNNEFKLTEEDYLSFIDKIQH